MNNISIKFYSFKVLMTPVLMTNGRVDSILSIQGRIEDFSNAGMISDVKVVGFLL